MNLHGPVRAAADAGVGTAIVKISLSDWPEGQVASTTHALTVIAPRAGVRSEPVSPQLVRSLVHPERKASVWDVRFTPDGRLFAAGYPSGVVQIFDLASGKELRRIESPPGYRGTADYANPTADFKRLYVPVDRRKVVTVEQDGTNQKRITYKGELLVWDVTTGKPLPSIKPSAPDRGFVNAFLSPAEDYAVLVEAIPHATTERDRVRFEVRLVDLRTGTAKSLGLGYGIAAFTADGKRLVVSMNGTPADAARLFVLDVSTGTELWAAKPPAKGHEYSAEAISRNGQRLAVQDFIGRIDQPSTLRVFEMETGKEAASFESGGKYIFMRPALSPDGSLLAATDWKGKLTVWDLKGKTEVRVHAFADAQAGYRIAFSPDGETLAVPVQPNSEGNREREPDPADLPQPRIYLFDLMSQKEPAVLMCPHGYLGGLAFSPDGQTLAFGSSGAVHLFDLRTLPKK